MVDESSLHGGLQEIDCKTTYKGVKRERQENAPSAALSSLVTAARRGIAQNIVPSRQRLSARKGNRTF